MHKKTAYWKGVFFGCLISLLNAHVAFGNHSTGFITEWTLIESPSLPRKPVNKRETYISCYDRDTLISLDCPFTHTITGVKPPSTLPDNNGGHNHHFGTHPVIEPPNGALQFSDVDLDPSPLAVRGGTKKTEVLVTHPIPQAAGKIVVETLLDAPRGWYCSKRCFTHTVSKYRHTLDIDVKRLIKMPASSAFHVVVRGGTGTHPEGTWGTLDTVGRAVYLAYEYFDLIGRRLSINDLSLPKGGLFDINNNWTDPHITHRTGTDMDLNQADEGGVKVSCEADWKLKKAVERAHRQLPPIKLLKCSAEKSPGHKHVDFD